MKISQTSFISYMKAHAIIYLNVILVCPDHPLVPWPGNWELYLIPMRLPDVTFTLNTKLFSIPVRWPSEHFASYLGVFSPYWIANIYRVVFMYPALFQVLYRDYLPNSYNHLTKFILPEFSFYRWGNCHRGCKSLPQSHTARNGSQPLNPSYQALKLILLISLLFCF